MIDTPPSLMTAEMALAKQNLSAKDNLRMGRIKEAAVEFEAMFISEMLKPMFEGIKTDGMFGGGKGEEVFRGFLLQEYGKSFAQNNSFGIADHVKAAMIEMQASQNHTSTPINGDTP